MFGEDRIFVLCVECGAWVLAAGGYYLNHPNPIGFDCIASGAEVPYGKKKEKSPTGRVRGSDGPEAHSSVPGHDDSL